MASQTPTDPVRMPRWARVEELYHAALEHRGRKRDAFLEAACSGDEALLREVRSLLAYERQAERFIEGPADDDGADRLAGGPLGVEEVRAVFRQIARVWRRRARGGSP